MANLHKLSLSVLVLALILASPLAGAAELTGPGPGEVWLTPASGLIPVEGAALGSRIVLGFDYSSQTVDDVELSLSQVWLLAQVAFADRIEVGLMLPLLSTISLDRGSESDMGNLRLDAKLKLLGRTGGAGAVSYFVKLTLPTYTAEIDDRGSLGVWLHHGVLTGGENKGVLYGLSLALVHWIRSGTDFHLVDVGGYLGYRLLTNFAVQLTIQNTVPAAPSGKMAIVLSPVLRVTPVARLYFEVGGRFAVSEEGQLNTGSSFISGGRSQLLVGLGYCF
jgi:hypothetical protein